MLATVVEHQRGSAADKPTECTVCSSRYWVEARLDLRRLTVHRVMDGNAGRYVTGRVPKLTSGTNEASWIVVKSIMSAYGGAEYEVLVAAVSQHDHPAGGKGFIDYCIRNEWLRRV